MTLELQDKQEQQVVANLDIALEAAAKAQTATPQGFKLGWEKLQQAIANTGITSDHTDYALKQNKLEKFEYKKLAAETYGILKDLKSKFENDNITLEILNKQGNALHDPMIKGEIYYHGLDKQAAQATQNTYDKKQR